MTIPIRIMTRDFELVGEVDAYDSLQIERSWHGQGSLELRINRYMPYANELRVGRIIFPQNRLNKTYVIKSREIELDSDGKASENWSIGAEPLTTWLGQRLTIPPADIAQDTVEGDAETVMKHYVNTNVVNPIDPGDKLPGLTLAPNLRRGGEVKWSSRYKNFAEELEEISLVGEVGWNIELDFAEKEFVFDVSEGRDLTASQKVLPPAIFSTEFNTLSSMSYTESVRNYKNHAIIAGQGEGADRRVVSIGNATGFDRHTIFVDARDVAEETDAETPIPRPPADIIADLVTRGEQKLAEYQQEIYLEGGVQANTIERVYPKVIEHSYDTPFRLKPINDPSQPERYEQYAVQELQSIDLSALGQYQNSNVEWSANLPTSTSLTVEYSFNGVDWTTIRNQRPLSLKEGEWLNGKKLYFRHTITTNDATVTPTLLSFKYTIRGKRKSTEKIIGVGSLEYEKDFDLGDIVTVQNKDWGVTLDARITAIREIYEVGKRGIEVTFGNNKPTLITKIKQELSGIKTEITR